MALTLKNLPEDYTAAAIYGKDMGDHILILAWSSSLDDSKPVLADQGEGFKPIHWLATSLEWDTAGWVGRVVASQWLERKTYSFYADVAELTGWLCNRKNRRLRRATAYECLLAITKPDDVDLTKEAGRGWLISSD